MKYKAKIAVMLLVAFVCWAFPLQVWAETAEPQKPKVETNNDYTSDDIIIKDNAIIEPITQGIPSTETANAISRRAISGRHSTRAEKEINPNSLRRYLDNAHSPLAEYAEQIAASPYSSTIIAICTIEQYGCTRAPGNNYWGLGPHNRYASLPDGISAIDSFLAKADAGGRTTVEQLNCWYVQPCSSNWLNVVLKTKLELESLTN